jgi:Concanavalin A-like lectin/glucanases superfamily
MMNTVLSPRSLRLYGIFCVIILFLLCGTLACAQTPALAPEPAVYLNFDEGSGNSALDSSGHGNSATLFNTSRIETAGCSRALVFSNPDSYVAIPFRVLNHPSKEITVSTWFYIDNYTAAPLVSGYNNGGYRLGFGDGDDLWWTVNLENTGDFSVAVAHENIALHQWHHVTGTYDGNTLKLYLDGILRNQANITGTIHYEDENYVLLGAEAGTADTPADCPHHLTGGLDEVRIYPVALGYSQVMDDRFRCIEGDRLPPEVIPAETAPGTCGPVSGSVSLAPNETAVRVLSFTDKTVNVTWQVSLQPGSLLSVRAYDFYANAYPDEWYLEIADGAEKPVRTIAFPRRINAPAEAMLPTGNATVTVRYFSGNERFPATVLLRFDSLPPVPPRQAPQKNILENPIIVIYTASWATLVAILLVIIWLHRRRKARKTECGKTGSEEQEDKKL